MHKYILFFTLLILLAGCSANSGGAGVSGQSYADKLRSRANGRTIPTSEPTTPPTIAAPTPAPQPLPRPTEAPTRIDVNVGVDDSVIALVLFVTSPAVMFAFAVAVAGVSYLNRRKK